MATILRPVSFAISLAAVFQRPLAARADGDVDAFLGQRQRDALADAFLAAGHQRGLALSLRSIAGLRQLKRLRPVKQPQIPARDCA